MGKKSTPDAPDYEGLAEMTAESGREMLQQQTWANRADQFSHEGSSTWDNVPQWDASTGQYVDKWTNTTKLNPMAQNAYDSQLAMKQGRSNVAGSMMGRIAEEFGGSMDWDQYGNEQGLEFDPNQMRDRAENSIMDRFERRMNPQFEGQREQAEIRLRGQGLAPGDQAYEAEMGRLGMQETDARQEAMTQAVGQGRGESAQMYGQQTSSADYANKLRQNAINENITKRSQSLNEANALESGAQIATPQFAGYNQAGRAAGTDYSGAGRDQFSADKDIFSAKQAQSQMLMDGAMAGGGMMMCDRRLKKNIKRIGTYLGHAIYSFTYLWGDKAVGPMADEVNPEAVTRLPCGYDMVNLAKLQPR